MQDAVRLSTPRARVMAKRQQGWVLLAVWAALLGVPADRVEAISLVLDYRHDTFFSGQPTARAAIEAAASDLSDAITSTLNAIHNDVIVGTSGSTNATYDMFYGYTNPSNGSARVDRDGNRCG